MEQHLFSCYSWRCVLLFPSHFWSGWGITYIYYFQIGLLQQARPSAQWIVVYMLLLFHIFQILQSQSVLLRQGIYSKALLHLCPTDNILFQASLRTITKRSTENTIFMWQKVRWDQTPSHWYGIIILQNERRCKGENHLWNAQSTIVYNSEQL